MVSWQSFRYKCIVGSAAVKFQLHSLHCVAAFQLRSLSLVCIKWGVFFKARINPQSHSPCNLKGVNFFRNHLNVTQMSERKSNITQRKIKTSFDHKFETLYGFFWDSGVCICSCHCGLNFEKAIGKTNDRRNNTLFQ